MPADATDRRRAHRLIPSPTQPLSRVRLRTGRDLTVIDASPLGVLVEGDTRLLPGTHVDVHVIGAQGRILVHARVVRCTVWGLTASEVRYRSALSFGGLVELGQTDPQPAESPAPPP